ncbi:MAG: hypothetical protein HYT42_00105 [Candidatus Sungbacteria bacterium]|nr:hypothetical protein [Candidatus Sungbacteria bacterium]
MNIPSRSSEALYGLRNKFLESARAASWLFRKNAIKVFQYVAKRELSRRGYLNFLKDRPKDAFAPSLGDLWFLYRMVRRRKPACILEFGSGCSTVLMAQALADNAERLSSVHGFIYSVDADSRWAAETEKFLPSHLKSFCEISYSPLLEGEYDGVPVFRHARIPNVRPDMLFLDGPALTAERQAAADPLDIENRFPQHFCMIVDGRWANTMFLKKHLKRRYGFRNLRLSSMSIFELAE